MNECSILSLGFLYKGVDWGRHFASAVKVREFKDDDTFHHRCFQLRDQLTRSCQTAWKQIQFIISIGLIK